MLQLAFRNAAATWRKKYEVIVTTKPRIAIVIGSTRPGRYADKAAGWMLKQTQARDDIEAELVDLRDHPMPFFDEKGPPMSTPSENAEALRWQETLLVEQSFLGGRPAGMLAEDRNERRAAVGERAKPLLAESGLRFSSSINRSRPIDT
jgi:hypothetical protein